MPKKRVEDFLDTDILDEATQAMLWKSSYNHYEREVFGADSLVRARALFKIVDTCLKAGVPMSEVEMAIAGCLLTFREDDWAKREQQIQKREELKRQQAWVTWQNRKDRIKKEVAAAVEKTLEGL